jgi:hypothetical protein
MKQTYILTCYIQFVIFHHIVYEPIDHSCHSRLHDDFVPQVYCRQYTGSLSVLDLAEHLHTAIR